MILISSFFHNLHGNLWYPRRQSSGRVLQVRSISNLLSLLSELYGVFSDRDLPSFYRKQAKETKNNDNNLYCIRSILDFSDMPGTGNSVTWYGQITSFKLSSHIHTHTHTHTHTQCVCVYNMLYTHMCIDIYVMCVYVCMHMYICVLYLR